MSKVALIIIYNHQYNKNIEILERIYKDRFSDIYHLVPFYTGDKDNVIPVYENSYYFQNYVAQGLKSYFKKDYIHYFFIADDLILNPILNEENYTEHLKLKENSCFLPRLDTIHLFWKNYNIKPLAAYRYRVQIPGVEVKNMLPDPDTALRLLKRFGIDVGPLHFYQIFPKPIKPILAFRYKLLSFLQRNKKFHLTYPLTSSYSDIFVVSSKTIKQFCHYCGIFAATNLFVEVALPTAMALSAEEIILEKNLDFKGGAMWSNDDYKVLDKYNFSIKSLLEKFPTKTLYLHPIKLSKWSK